ncbi:hypothetical protein POM88_055043 [Heracleum sosnowskyi]|uniref:Uncharacterized protein n=1 Tax=Heracleum sosnowskyi TaxID=360622 RepID=A0AAD8GM11_9APIA|nr:hypothetical protein POM88_055043 [Heracleum sosnowskyi]
MAHQFSLAKNNFYNITTEVGDNLPRFKFWVRFLNLYSKASVAFTAKPQLVHDALLQLWTTAVTFGNKTTPYGFRFTLAGREYEVTEEIVNRVLGFPVKDSYDPEPTAAERLAFFEEIGCYPPSGPITTHIQKQYFHVEWNYFFEAITRCFRAREKDFHQIPIPMQTFGVALARELDINYGRIVLSEIVASMGSTASRDLSTTDVVCWYPRFLQMLINHFVPSNALAVRQGFAGSQTSAPPGMGTKSLSTIANQDKHRDKPITFPANIQVWMRYDEGVTTLAESSQVSSHAQNPSAHAEAFDGIPDEESGDEQGNEEGNFSLHTTQTSSYQSDSMTQETASPQDLSQGESHISESDTHSYSLSPLLTGAKRQASVELREDSESNHEGQPIIRKKAKISHAATSKAQSKPNVSHSTTPPHESGSPQTQSPHRDFDEDYVPFEDPVTSRGHEALKTSEIPSQVRTDATKKIGSDVVQEHFVASQPEIPTQETTGTDPITANYFSNPISAGTATHFGYIIEDIHERETGSVCERLGREGPSFLRPETERQTLTEPVLERGHLSQTPSLHVQNLATRVTSMENQMRQFGESMGQLGINVGNNQRALDDYAARMASQATAFNDLTNQVIDLGHAGGVLGNTLNDRMGAMESNMDRMTVEISRMMFAIRSFVPPECFESQYSQPPPNDGAGGAGGTRGAGASGSGFGGSFSANLFGDQGGIQDNSPKGESGKETRQRGVYIEEIIEEQADLVTEKQSEPAVDEEAQRIRKGKAVAVELEEPVIDMSHHQEGVQDAIDSDSDMEDVPLAHAIKRSMKEQGGGAGMSSGQPEEIPVDKETLEAQQLALEQAQFYKMKSMQEHAAFLEKKVELQGKQYEFELARLADPQVDLDNRRIGQKWDDARKILRGSCAIGVNNKDADNLFYNLNLQNPLTMDYINALKNIITKVRVGYNATTKEWQVILSLVGEAPMSFMYIDEQFISRRSASELYLLATKIQNSQAEELSILYRDQLMQLAEDKGPEFSAHPDIVRFVVNGTMKRLSMEENDLMELSVDSLKAACRQIMGKGFYSEFKERYVQIIERIIFKKSNEIWKCDVVAPNPLDNVKIEPEQMEKQWNILQAMKNVDEALNLPSGPLEQGEIREAVGVPGKESVYWIHSYTDNTADALVFIDADQNQTLVHLSSKWLLKTQDAAFLEKVLFVFKWGEVEDKYVEEKQRLMGYLSEIVEEKKRMERDAASAHNTNRVKGYPKMIYCQLKADKSHWKPKLIMKNFSDIPKIRTTQEVDKLRRLFRHPYPEPKNPLEMEAVSLLNARWTQLQNPAYKKEQQRKEKQKKENEEKRQAAEERKRRRN